MAQPVSVSMEAMKADFPEVSDDIFSEVVNAPPWKNKFNERNVFNSMYNEVAQFYYPDATDIQDQGRTMLDLFEKWKPVVEKFTRHVLRGDTDDPLDAVLNWDAEGAGQAVLRPLNIDSFANASYTSTPTSTGEFDWIPNDAAGSVETATDNEQGWIIIGHVETVAGNEVPYHYAQADVNDDIGVRRQEWIRTPMASPGTLKWWERSRGPLLIEPGFTLDYDLDIHEPNIETGLWPIGFEVIRADAAEFAGEADA